MKAVLYCLKSKPYLVNKERIEIITKRRDNIWLTGERYAYDNWVNGKIVAECDYKTDFLYFYQQDFYDDDGEYKTVHDWNLKESVLNETEIWDYLTSGQTKEEKDYGYAIKIINLFTYDEPKEITDYVKGDWIEYSNGPTFFRPEAIEHVPKNMTFIWSKENGDQYVFIPVHPEQLCKILNKECTIIIKKRVPKELR